MKKQEQIESELRFVIKRAKKNVFVKLTLTELIENSRRMYLIYNTYKSGEKFKINNNDENILFLNDISSNFESLNLKIKKIPKPIKELLDRKWEKEPNTKESLDGSIEVLLKKLLELQKEFKKLVLTLNKDFKSGTIINVDPIPIAVTHSAMTIWTELLKNKYNLKNQKIISKNLINFLQEVFEVFACEADVKKSYMNWHTLKNM
ncbi:MAG: hypothetical protein P8J21_03760 [Alphaproteobacteria bacterium]|jgi:hypothetical protein|nr:hypothetical protein [Alphaproteobacteria bacterium]|tara:strand:+ start:559 stop:1173 length:615 start_codon:yes stop_codon:yes gene_type:complete